MIVNRESLTLVGNTPIVEITCFDTGLCSLFVKLESSNPAGSIKDRVALSMIESAEREGKLVPGGTIIEATAGNTGLGLAFIAALRGYRIKLVIPDKMSREKINHLQAMGAEIIVTRSDVGKGHPAYYQDLAQSIADSTPNSFYVNQFSNPANPLAHETGTAPEIWSQMGHNVDAIVCGVGSGGTITGLSRFFQRVSPGLELVLADPYGSILAHYIETGEVRTDAGSWLVEGIGEDFIPSIADLSRVKKAYTVTDKESFETARTLLNKEGILGGSSTGTLITAALRYCKEQTVPKRVVTFVCDSGAKYLSKMYNDYWMIDQGFLDLPKFGDLRDLISRRHSDKATVVVSPEDTLLTAFGRMKTYDVSQLPVIEKGQLLGIVDESDLLLAVHKDQSLFRSQVRNVMSGRLKTFPPSTPLESLLPVFEEGMVVIVEDDGKFLGLVTKIDLLNFLRRRLP